MVPEKQKHMGTTAEVRTTIVRTTDVVIACVSSIMKKKVVERYAKVFHENSGSYMFCKN